MTRLAVILSSFAICSALSAPAYSQTEAAAPVATMAKPAKTFKVLTPSDVDPSMLLAPPAKDGSDVQKGELQEVLRLYRTTARFSQRRSAPPLIWQNCRARLHF